MKKILLLSSPPQPTIISQPSLLTNLVSYWKLDENSPGIGAITRYDSIAASANHLTDTNNVPSSPGIIGNGAQFTIASSQRLTIASNASLQVTNADFTLACWVKFNALPATTTQVLVGKINSTSALSTTEYGLQLSNASPGRFRMNISDGSNVGGSFSNTTVTPSTGVWYFVIGWYDSVADLGHLQVNNGTDVTNSYAFGTFAGSNAFSIGGTGTAGQYASAVVDEVGFWKRVLTATERTFLYNNGLGVTFS
jgi:hypothetical protein